MSNPNPPSQSGGISVPALVGGVLTLAVGLAGAWHGSPLAELGEPLSVGLIVTGLGIVVGHPLLIQGAARVRSRLSAPPRVPSQSIEAPATPWTTPPGGVVNGLASPPPPDRQQPQSPLN